MQKEKHEFNIPLKPKPYVMAHRGNNVLFPENTLVAFQQAIDEGADIVETDLHLTKDNVFVCIHDTTVDRTTNGTGAVAELTLAELKALSASYGRPEHQDQTIPTLEEFLAIIPDETLIALELKTDRFLEEEVNQQLITILEKYNIVDRTMVIGFSEARLLAVKALEPRILTGFITMSKEEPKTNADFMGAAYPVLFLKPWYIFKAKRIVPFFCPLDPDPIKRLWYYRLMKADCVLADNPGEVIQKIKTMKPWSQK